MSRRGKKDQQRLRQQEIERQRSRERLNDQVRVVAQSQNQQQPFVAKAKVLINELRTFAAAGTLKTHLLGDMELVCRFSDEVIGQINPVAVKAVSDDCLKIEDRIAWWKFCKDLKKGSTPLKADSKDDFAGMLIDRAAKTYLDEINPDPEDVFCFGSFANTTSDLWKRIVTETREAHQLPALLIWLETRERHELQALMRSYQHKLLLGLMTMARGEEVGKIFSFLKAKDIVIERSMYLDESSDGRNSIKLHSMWDGISLSKFRAFAGYARIENVPTVITYKTDRTNSSYLEKHLSAPDFDATMSWMRERGHLFTPAQVGAVRDTGAKVTQIAASLLKAGKANAYFALPVSTPIDHGVFASQLSELVGKGSLPNHLLSQITPEQWAKMSEQKGLGTNTDAQLGYALLPVRSTISRIHAKVKDRSPS